MYKKIISIVLAALLIALSATGVSAAKAALIEDNKKALKLGMGS